MTRFILLVLFCSIFASAKPLSEVIKDIEVSGEARYRFESNSYKKEHKNKIMQEARKKALEH